MSIGFRENANQHPSTWSLAKWERLLARQISHLENPRNGKFFHKTDAGISLTYAIEDTKERIAAKKKEIVRLGRIEYTKSFTKGMRSTWTNGV